MIVYKKGWYSVCNCETLNLKLTKQNELVDDLAEQVKKYIFILKKEEDEFTRYETIRKTWIRINTYNETEGLIQKKMPILRKFTFDYYRIQNLIIFHSGINKVLAIIRYLNNEFKSKINIPKSIDLKIFLNELEKSSIKYTLIEGMIINHKLKGSSIGNFHFKNLTEQDYNDLFSQDDSYLSWIKLNVQGYSRNIDMILYLNGTFYQKRKDKMLSNVLEVYFNFLK
ncbi:MAG: hypothetical protein V3V33_04550 [Candidatus Lokiarchaeia archaeon]